MYAHLARARHARSSEDMAAILAAAHARRDRRLQELMRLQGGFPSAELWHTLDLAHEATRLIDRIEQRIAAAEEAAAESAWIGRTAEGLLA